MTDLEQKGKELADAVIEWSQIPPNGNEKWTTDIEFGAEVMVPLAGGYLEACKQRHGEDPAAGEHERELTAVETDTDVVQANTAPDCGEDKRPADLSRLFRDRYGPRHR